MKESGKGDAEELRLVLADGKERPLGRVLASLLHHSCPLVVLRLAQTSPRPQVKAQYGESLPPRRNDHKCIMWHGLLLLLVTLRLHGAFLLAGE